MDLTDKCIQVKIKNNILGSTIFVHPYLSEIKKGKVSPLQARLWPRGWVEISFYSSKTAALEEGEWSAARPSRTLPPVKTRYPLYRRLGGPQGRSGWAENLAPTGIRSPDRPAHSQSLYRLSYHLSEVNQSCYRPGVAQRVLGS